MKIGALRRVAFFALLMVCWATLSKFAHVDPSPGQVFGSLRDGVADRSLLIAAGISLRRLLIGYGISLAIGIPLGIWLARSTFAEETVGSMVLGLQTLPSVCWLPLALLWFGLNDAAILFVVIMGALLAITVSVRDGVKNLPPAYLRAARVMGARPLSIYTEVIVPASLPAILTGAKLGWSFAWRSLMAGELLFVSRGLGQMLDRGRELADMSQVIAVMLVIVALGLLTDRTIFDPIEQQVRERWGLSGVH